ncbi:MAG: DUF4442 domain-containing protein [Candidatus Nucleicultricaceae bacterium]
MKRKWIFRYINFWPPFIGAGIRVKKMTKDFRLFEVELKLRFWNKNAMGTHFGGSLFSMTDPFYVLMLANNLGRDYAVWDKSSSIRFKKPARGKIIAKFYISPEEIERIKSEADQSDRSEPYFKIHLTDELGDVVAEVEKTLSIKLKSKTKHC